jgi:formylglycine-generating enzyme
MRLPRPLALVAALIASSCVDAAPAREQWLVRVETDAPIPLLGDQVLVEVVAPDGSAYCSSCQRIFTVSSPADFPLSFGIVRSASVAAPLVRARLFRSRNQGSTGVPLPELAIDSLGRLPAPIGLTSVTLPLPARCTGVAADLTSFVSCSEHSGDLEPTPTLTDRTFATAGSWTDGVDEPCPEAPPDGMVCVPGGLFALGESNAHPLLRDGLGPELGTRPERLVRLSPFAIDALETTIAQYDVLVPEAPRRVATCPAAELDPDRPANCVSFVEAGRACAARGLRLPTEAEFEYVAGNRGLETPFPWGHSPDICTYAVIAQGKEVYRDCAIENGRLVEARTSIGGNGRDQTLPVSLNGLSGVVFDLGGNLSEWVLDDIAPYDAACRAAVHIQQDPLCRVEGKAVGWAVRGGAYNGFTAAALSYARLGTTSVRSSDIGFRCVKSYGAAHLE